jgi:hypothetical protein
LFEREVRALMPKHAATRKAVEAALVALSAG